MPKVILYSKSIGSISPSDTSQTTSSSSAAKTFWLIPKLKNSIDITNNIFSLL